MGIFQQSAFNEPFFATVGLQLISIEGADMGRRTRDELLRDVYARQRDVVFPDTAQNEARFWRNIVEAPRTLTCVQVIGIVLIVGCLMFCVALLGVRGLGLVLGAVAVAIWLHYKGTSRRPRPRG
jgi:hypothetical protein